MKKKLMSTALAFCMAIGLAVPAFAAGETKGPWNTADAGGYGTAVKEASGWYLLKGDAEPANMKTGPYVSFKSMVDGADFSKGFTSSVTLDLSGMKAGEDVAWSLSVTGKEADADGYDYLDEADFHFSATEDGKPQLKMLASNASGSADGQNINKSLETPVTAADGKFALTAKFAPNADCKMEITFIVNGTEVDKWATTHVYAEDVKAPRSSWLFQTCTEAGVRATLPSIATIEQGDWVAGDGSGTVVKQKDGTFRLFGDTDPASINMMTGPFLRPAYDGLDLTNGFTVSAKLDFSDMKAGESAAWSFGLTNVAKDTNGYDYLDEAAFHFNAAEDGKARLVMLESNASGNPDGDTNIRKTLETPVTAADSVFALTAKFTPNTDGKLVITFLANGQEVDSWTTSHDYSAVKGPRYGWLFQGTVAAGVLALEVPTAAAVTVLPEDATVTPVEDGKAEDTKNGVSVETDGDTTLPEDVVLVVVPMDTKTNEDIKDLVKEAPYDQADAAFDISLMKGDQEIEKLEDGRLKVTIGFEAKEGREYALYHIKDDGTYEKMEATFKDGKVVFYTDSFSPFVVLSKEAAPEKPATGETLPLAVAGLAVAAAGVLLIMKKRTARSK